MVGRLLDSMTLGRKAQRLLTLITLLVLAACTSREVIVEGTFPTPLVDPVPVSVGVLFTQEFKEHELVDDATGRGEVSWRVSTGTAQVEFWSTLFPAFFQNVVFIESYEDLQTYDVDAVLIPQVADVQYAIPLYTNVKVYEIWMRYNLALVEPEQIIDEENASHLARKHAALRRVASDSLRKNPYRLHAVRHRCRQLGCSHGPPRCRCQFYY